MILLLACTALILAEEPITAAGPEFVKPLDGGRFQIGEIVFDRNLREIRFPAEVNMTEGSLEFLIVHEKGKVHEALLATKISPTHLNLAFTLLRYKPSPELYPLPAEEGGAAVKFPDVPVEIKDGARIAIEVEWSEDGKLRRLPVNEWVQHGEKADDMPAGPWVYGGSEVVEGKYQPEVTGDIAAIYLSDSALINYPGADNTNDDVWAPFPKRVPPKGTKVTVILSPYDPAKTPAKP